MKKSFLIGNVPIGDGSVTVQSMTNTPTYDVEKTSEQIAKLAEAGADIVRVSVPDTESAEAIKYLVQKSPVPLVGDIHFSSKSALIAIENGIHKIRVNPGNMKEKEIREIVKKCIEYDIPIRVGINKGSAGLKSPEELARLTYDSAKKIEDMGWDKLVLAVKTSNVSETVTAYRKLASLCDYPLHVGLTEAGTAQSGEIKSAIAIGSLLLDGIGNTVRVSLSGNPVQEVYAAQKILRAVGIDKRFVEVIACPTCARTCFPVDEVAKSIEEATKFIKKPIKIAVMGCVVNGLGEAGDADFGVAGGKDHSLIFRNGQKLKTVPNDAILQELLRLTEEF